MATARYNQSQYGNRYVDSLASEYAWTRGDTIRYYLQPTGGATSSSGTPVNWTAAGGADAFAKAAAAWSAVCNISFAQVLDKGSADIVESTYSDPESDTLATHYYPNSEQEGGEFNVGRTDLYNSGSNQPGGNGFMTFLHELGHGLGLNHPFEGDGTNPFPGVSQGDETDPGDHDLNDGLTTVMGYDHYLPNAAYAGEGHGYAATPMAFDIAAVQAIYGANTQTHAGNDTYRLPSSNGVGTSFDCIWDAGGIDTIVAGQHSCTIDLRPASLLNAEGGGGYLSSDDLIAGGFTIAHGAIIENAIGSKEADFLCGNDASNVLTGGGGGDEYRGGKGADTFVISSGNNQAYIQDYESGVDHIRAKDFKATSALVSGLVVRGGKLSNAELTLRDAHGHHASVQLEGNQVIAHLSDLAMQFDIKADSPLKDFVGGVFDDHITGFYRADTIAGAGGNDSVNGGDGNDTLSGGSGDDKLDGGLGNDRLDGGAGHDRLVGSPGDDTFVVDSVHDKIFENSDRVYDYDTVESSVSWTLGNSLEGLVLAGKKELSGTGNSKNNGLTGNRADNWLSGLDGDDTMAGGDGDDHLDGGHGHDTLAGGAGNDVLIVDNRADKVMEHRDDGFDAVWASVNWTLGDNIEALILRGGDHLSGTGNALSNTISGNNASNALNGLAADDVLFGKDGEDVLTGGAGRDLLSGGRGDDRFVFDDNDSSARDAAADHITDFNSHERIDLHLIDARAGGRDSAFTWIGERAFGDHASDLRFYQAGGNTLVEGDTDGDGRRDFKIVLDGLHELSASNFVL